MPEEILYEFDGFRLDPARCVLLFEGQPTELTAKPFKLLLTLVEKHGQSIPKEELMSRVWPGSLVTDDNFHVNLNKVRKALGESASNPQFIFRTDDGYKFVADVKLILVGSEKQTDGEVPAPNVGIGEEKRVASERNESQIIGQVAARPRTHLAHILVSSVLYGALYASAMIVEIAYEYDRFGGSALRISPLVFGWITITSVLGLVADQKLTLQDRRGGLVISVLVFLLSAMVAFAGVTFLPSSPITLAGFQTYPAQTAYLKDMVYFLVLAFVFMILPFHFVSEMESEMQRGRYRYVLDALTSRGLAVLPGGMIYPRVWALTLVLLLFVVLAIPMTAHLLDNLTPGPYTNLFTQLFYVRGILYFILGVECLIWYYGTLNKLKRKCISSMAGPDHY